MEGWNLGLFVNFGHADPETDPQQLFWVLVSCWRCEYLNVVGPIMAKEPIMDLVRLLRLHINLAFGSERSVFVKQPLSYPEPSFSLSLHIYIHIRYADIYK